MTATDEGVSTVEQRKVVEDGSTTSPRRQNDFAVVIPKSPVTKGEDPYYSLDPSDNESPLSSLESSPSFPRSRSTDVLPEGSSEYEPSLDVKPSKRRAYDLKRTRSRSAIAIDPATPAGETDRKNYPKVSPYFPKSPTEKVSCIPFPPLKSTSFGLVQEKLCHDPFKLLIAVIFLNKTKGTAAMPVFYDVVARYPTPADLAAAKLEELVEMIQHLGLQNQRAAKCIKLAQAWLKDPPQKGKRYRRLHYPAKNDGKDIKASDGPINDEDERVAWEVGHLPGIGAYAIDSWRIFCRDELRGLPTGLPEAVTPATIEQEMDKEWTRVLPQDKELRAYLRWRWLRLGWEWDFLNGDRKEVDSSLYAETKYGGVVYEGDKHWSFEGQDAAQIDRKSRPESVQAEETGIEATAANCVESVAQRLMQRRQSAGIKASQD